MEKKRHVINWKMGGGQDLKKRWEVDKEASNCLVQQYTHWGGSGRLQDREKRIKGSGRRRKGKRCLAVG